MNSPTMNGLPSGLTGNGDVRRAQLSCDVSNRRTPFVSQYLSQHHRLIDMRHSHLMTYEIGKTSKYLRMACHRI
jgi:hypothetical protein